jgi:hypothetical protein
VAMGLVPYPSVCHVLVNPKKAKRQPMLKIRNLALPFVFCGLALFSVQAFAYTQWILTGTTLNKNRPSHVLVVGYSHGMGNQFLQTAVARMLRYQEQFPDHTIVVYQPKVEVFEVRGLKKIAENNSELFGETLVKELLTYSDIRSLDFFSHSSAHQGIGIETGPVTLPEQSFFATVPSSNPVKKYRKGTPGLSKLKSVLHADAYMTINGCNSAWIQAPAFSKILERPVLAATTGTDFQRLFEDKEYYFNNEGQFPAEGQWAVTNDMAFESEKSCRTGACLRMKPQAGPYKGFWGDYTNVGSIGFYKFFCNYSGYDSSCYKTMARYLTSVLSKKPLRVASSRSDYVDVLYDMLCPISPSKPRRSECIASINAKLSANDEVFHPYPGTAADCSLQTCKFKDLTCVYNANGWASPGSCRFTQDATANGSTTLIREFKNYLRGLDELGIR